MLFAADLSTLPLVTVHLFFLWRPSLAALAFALADWKRSKARLLDLSRAEAPEEILCLRSSTFLERALALAWALAAEDFAL